MAEPQLGAAPPAPPGMPTPASWEDVIAGIAKKYQVDPRLALAVAKTESNLNPAAVSPVGARGLMQLMPETAKRWNVDIDDPHQNIVGGVQELRALLDANNNDVVTALRRYNASPQAPREVTDPYVQKVLAGLKPQARPGDITVPSAEDVARRTGVRIPADAKLVAVPPSMLGRAWETAKEFGGELQSLDPRNINAAVQQTFWHPVETAKMVPGMVRGALQSTGEIGQRMVEAAKAGDYLRAGLEAKNWLLSPLGLGQRLSAAEEYMRKGEITKGLGATADVSAMTVLPEVIRRVPEVTVLPRVAKSYLSDVKQRAVEFGQRRGIPVDLGTATGNRFVQRFQGGVESTPLGGGVRGAVERRRGELLPQLGEELAAGVYPTAVSAEQAGRDVGTTLQREIVTHHTDANLHYETVRGIEADPRNTVTVQAAAPVVGAAPPRPPAAPWPATNSPSTLFERVLDDARSQGYQGPTGQLRAAFDERLNHPTTGARALLEEMTGPHPDQQLLREVAANGGIGGIGPGDLFEGEFNWLRQGGKGGRIQDVPGVVKPKGGLTFEEMAERLRQIPGYERFTSGKELVDELTEVAGRARASTAAETTLGQTAEAVGITPGEPWWEPFFAEQYGASSQTAPTLGASTTEQMQLPVDRRGAKTALRPILDEMRRTMPIAQQQASPGLRAVENIVEGPDFAPLSITERDLSAVKAAARGADLPQLRSVSQGVAARAVDALSKEIDRTLATAPYGGEEAAQALAAGRRATARKYATAEVFDQLRNEPVGAFRQATAAGDAHIDYLRALAREAPREMPKIGRAVLDELLDRATIEGGYTRAASVANAWERLGPETRKLLFGPNHTEALDNFFLLAKMLAEHPNPSMSALTITSALSGAWAIAHPVTGVSGALAGYGLATLLNSPRGVRLLTRGLTIPGESAAARVWGAEVASLLGKGMKATKERQQRPGTPPPAPPPTVASPPPRP